MTNRGRCIFSNRGLFHSRLVIVITFNVLALSTFFTAEKANSQAPPTVNVNILSRVFRIRLHDSQKRGTAFTIDVEGRQYLVTAKHVIPNACLNDTIELYHEKQWKSLPVQVFVSDIDSADVALLIPPSQISPAFAAPPSSDKMLLGQDCYFIGFPYGLFTDEQGVMSGFPVPLIRKGTIAAMIRHDGWKSIVVDGNANPGNSGGPLVFWQEESKAYQICGVITQAYLQEDTAIARIGNDSVPVFFRKAAGLAVATEISTVLNLIKAHPVGVRISEDEKK